MVRTYKVTNADDISRNNAIERNKRDRATTARYNKKHEQERIGRTIAYEEIQPHDIGYDYISGKKSIKDVEHYLNRFNPGPTKDAVREGIMRGVENGERDGLAKASRIQPIQAEMKFTKARRSKKDEPGKLAPNPHYQKLLKTHATRKKRLLDLYELDARRKKDNTVLVKKKETGYKPMKQERGVIYRSHKTTPYRMTVTNETKKRRVQ